MENKKYTKEYFKKDICKYFNGEKEFNLSEKRKEVENLLENANLHEGSIKIIMDYIQAQDKEFIKRRMERTLLICKLYPHKHGEELAAEINEDLIKDAGDKLI